MEHCCLSSPPSRVRDISDISPWEQLKKKKPNDPKKAIDETYGL